MARRAGDIYDELLVMRCQDGDRGALETLTKRWHGRLLRYAYQHCGDEDGAHDIVQEGWLAIVRGIHKLDDPAVFKAWAYRIVSHKCCDWVRGRVRGRRLRMKMERDLRGSEQEGSLREVDDDILLLREAMAGLTGEERGLLHLRYVEEMSVPMIAMVLSIAEGTVKSRLHHLREMIRQELNDDNE